MIKEFESIHFLIRPIDEHDLDFAYEHWTQELDIARYMTWKPHQSKEETRQFIKTCLEGWSRNSYTWIIEKKVANEIVGCFAARRDEHKVDIGYLLLKKYWGNGYMTEVIRAFIDEAFKIDGIVRIWAVCDVDNLASRRAMEKSGMSYEGLLKSWLVHPNMSREPRDCHCLSIVRNEVYQG